MPSTKTPLVRAISVVAMVVLAGCLELPGQSPAFNSNDVSISTRSIDLINRARQRERVKLVQGEVIVRAPEGYCVERSSRSAKDFVLLGDCNVLRKTSTHLKPYERGLLSVSVGDILPTPPTIGEVTETLDQIGDTKRRGKIVTVLVPEGGDRLVPGADSVYWRGVTIVNNRVVTIAAFGPPYSDISLGRGQNLVTELAANIQAESPRIDPNTRIASVESATETASDADGGSVFDFFGRLRQKN